MTKCAFDISSDYSSDNEVDEYIAKESIESRPFNAPDYMTLKNLVENREKEKIEEEALEKELEQFSEEIPDAPQEEQNMNETIFGNTKIPYPSLVFKKIVTRKKIIKINTVIPNWMYSASMAFSDNFNITDKLIYNLLYDLYLRSDERCGNVIVNIYNYIPKKILDFEIICPLIEKIYCANEKFLIYPLILLHPSFFIKYDDELLEFMFLLLGGILADSVSQHPLFNIIVKNLEATLSDPEVKPKDGNLIADDIVSILKSIPPEASERFIAYMPFNQESSGFVLNVITKLIAFYLELEDLPLTTSKRINYVVTNVRKIKTLAETGESSKIIFASAATALLEKMIFLAIMFEKIDRKIVTRLISNLNFFIHVQNSANLVKLREQLHVTRSHLVYLSEEVFGNSNIETKPFG